MNSPKRYSIMHDGSFSPDGLVEYEQGPLVSFSDYESMRSERDAEIERLRARLAAVVGIVQRTLQPAGSPPPGDEEILVRWICDSTLARLAEAERDAARLDWLANNPRGAQIVVDGKTHDCVFWGISSHPQATLREAIDAAMERTP